MFCQNVPETTRTRPFRAGESSIDGGIFGAPTAAQSTCNTATPRASSNSVQSDLFGGHAGWGTDDVPTIRLDPSAMDAAGSKKHAGVEDSRPALTERHDANKSSIRGGIFSGVGDHVQLQPKMGCTKSSIPGGIFG
mmetsp:Transcript_17884/g.29821  ORF Transcript_17884/g.29821 Transcript_17884/m.29821 type:complete len:136 (-) Transcript_17884:423-830(-)